MITFCKDTVSACIFSDTLYSYCILFSIYTINQIKCVYFKPRLWSIYFLCFMSITYLKYTYYFTVIYIGYIGNFSTVMPKTVFGDNI